MKFTSIVVVAALMSALGAGIAQAQSFRAKAYTGGIPVGVV